MTLTEVQIEAVIKAGLFDASGLSDAWCVGGRQNNPAYVAFLPNALHSSRGIALNMSIWAMNRAQIADAMLRTL